MSNKLSGGAERGFVWSGEARWTEVASLHGPSPVPMFNTQDVMQKLNKQLEKGSRLLCNQITSVRKFGITTETQKR